MNADMTAPGTSRFPRRRGALALLGLLLVLAAPFAWLLSLDHPMLRRTGLLMWILLAAGLAAGMAAAVADRRLFVRIFLALEVLLAAALAWGAFGYARLPAPGPAATAREARDFTLPGPGGTPVRLREELQRGPILLVFFRGRW